MKTIVWDVDDVLNGLLRAWLEQAWLPAHPGCTVTYEQITENPPHRVLHISLEEYLRSIDAFRAAKGADLEIAPPVVEWFHLHGHRARHAVLTAVPLRAADLWAGWVLRHLGRWVRSFNFVPSPREEESLPGYDHSKPEFLAWWGQADILVDDNVASVEGAASLGLQTVLVPQPWNPAPGSLADALASLTQKLD